MFSHCTLALALWVGWCSLVALWAWVMSKATRGAIGCLGSVCCIEGWLNSLESVQNLVKLLALVSLVPHFHLGGRHIDAFLQIFNLRKGVAVSWSEVPQRFLVGLVLQHCWPIRIRPSVVEIAHAMERLGCVTVHPVVVLVGSRGWLIALEGLIEGRVWQVGYIGWWGLILM